MKAVNAYFTVHSWMVKELQLKTVERDVFAVIYGFSMDGESDFHGSLSYLADITGYSRNSVCTALKNLVEKNLIKKDERELNNIKFCKYHVDFDTVQATCTPVQATCTNNIIDNKIKEESNISKDILSSKKSGMEKFEFGKKKTNSKPNLYTQCIACIDSYKEISPTLRNILVEYLQYRISIKDKPLYVNMWKGMLNKLLEFPSKQWNMIVKQSIELGYLSFYPLKLSETRIRLSEPTEGTGCEQATEEDDRKRGEFIRGLREQGKRADF